MHPVLQGGEKCLIVPCSFDEVSLGGVYVYRGNRDGQLVVHRAIGKNRWGWIMKGDHNRKCDAGYMRPDNLVGFVIFTDTETQLRVNESVRDFRAKQEGKK